MSILIGCTGFVGGHLARCHQFDLLVHRPNIEEVIGKETELLVCAGLPAEKWRANQYPINDWENTKALAHAVTRIEATTAVLISTIDVYQDPTNVNENDHPDFDGGCLYGTHRAWFEAFFRHRFPDSLIVRLPALFAPDLKKNLVHDFLHNKRDRWIDMNPDSQFQYFDVALTWSLIERALLANLKLLNVCVEPVRAQEIAGLFGVTLSADSKLIKYDVRSVYSDIFGGAGGYLFDKSHALSGIAQLRK